MHVLKKTVRVGNAQLHTVNGIFLTAAEVCRSACDYVSNTHFFSSFSFRSTNEAKIAGISLALYCHYSQSHTLDGVSS